MTVVCEIQFDNNPNGIYIAGQVVTGKVSMTVNKPKNVKGVLLKLCGYAKTAWTESETYQTIDAKGHYHTAYRSVMYSGREDYFSSLTYLMGSDGSTSVTIEPGFHTYSFACPLPMNCASSYEGTWGHIRYVAKVVLIRPWKLDQTYTVGFTVIKNLDLNYDSPLLRLPTNMEYVKQFCCWPCKTEPVIINVLVPQSGYVPGQAIPVTVNINNPTKVMIKGITMSLNMKTIFHSQYPQHRTRYSLVCLSQSKSNQTIGKRCKSVISDFLQIPPSPPSCLNLCSIITIMYELEVIAQVSGAYINPVVVIPITIGSVPLVNWNSPQNAAQQIEAALTADNIANVQRPQGIVAEVPMPSTSTESQDIPPPTYEQAMFMMRSTMADEEDKDPLGTTEFAPRYPVYSMSPSRSILTNDTARENVAQKTEVDPGNGTWI